MDIAFCASDKKTYDIASFSQLSSHLLDSLRRTLFCKECNGKAYYRKKSRDGKPACFGAYHEDECQYKLETSSSRFDPATIEEVNSLVTNNEIIDVKFETYTAQQPNASGNTSASLSSSRSAGGQQHTRQSQNVRNTTKGLRSLLRMLMHTDSFATSDIAINTGATHPYKAKNLFVNFDAIDESQIDKWRGYWGVISHADTELHWINTANEQDVSIPVAKIKDYLCETFNINSPDDLAGATVLVFGKLCVSSSEKKKWYIKITNDDPARIFIQLKK
jgi:hypothetical protein